MRLHQINVAYDRLEDRLLVRVSTDAQQEFRLWITRLGVSLMWPALMKMLETDELVSGQSDEASRRAVLGFRHEQALAASDFSKGYREGAVRPLGDTPLLVSRWRGCKGPDGKPSLTLSPRTGEGLTLSLESAMLHPFCALLRTHAEKAGWGLQLEFPATFGTPEDRARLN